MRKITLKRCGAKSLLLDKVAFAQRLFPSKRKQKSRKRRSDSQRRPPLAKTSSLKESVETPQAHGRAMKIEQASIVAPNACSSASSSLTMISGVRCSRCDNYGHSGENCPLFPLPRGQASSIWSSSLARPEVVSEQLKITDVQTRMTVRNGVQAPRVQNLRVNDRAYIVGTASSDGHNCLIYALQQQLGMDVDVAAVRNVLRKTFTEGPNKVEALTYLDLEAHWKTVVSTLGELWGSPSLTSRNLQIVCIDLDSLESAGATWHCAGNVVGTGPTKLHIARENGNHFVPLLRRVQ